MPCNEARCLFDRQTTTIIGLIQHKICFDISHMTELTCYMYLQDRVIRIK